MTHPPSTDPPFAKRVVRMQGTHSWAMVCLGDCREILPGLPKVDCVVTDPPYLNGDSKVPIRGGGVAPRYQETESVGMPWGFSLDWIDLCGDPKHWVVFANYRMLGTLCTRLPPSTVFVWRKNNAPRMTRPVPRLDCEFIVWTRSPKANCEKMGDFQSMVIDVPMLQAGCMAVEREVDETGRALHPCQKPVEVCSLFTARLGPGTYLDPFMGSGTTGVACARLQRNFIGIEIDENYFTIACRRIQAELDQFQLNL